MANGWSIIIGFVVIVLACVAGWFLSPKGETQTVWRSSLILSFASCYIMWGTFFPNNVSFLPGGKRLTQFVEQPLRSSHNGTHLSYPDEAA
ncbi:V-type proton ATPase subunit e [Lachnellula subtilissima]|uniref:V-type proton ATPase subunit e n=1 Tax=Lachnellula subtilissima TaxID=602034 RepID=A0A8H8RNJ7_9HELO|nr:V-type proton ATPase subunit e [Lachnellula subtilissima]